MLPFRACGSGAGGRKALLCVPLVVILWVLCTAKTATARSLEDVPRSVSPSAVQEPVCTYDELARALNRFMDLLSDKWTWIKVGLFTLGSLFVIEIWKIFTGSVTGVLTQVIVDWWKKPDAASANAGADPGGQQDPASHRMATSAGDIAREGNLTDSERRGVDDALKSEESAHGRLRSDEESVPPAVPAFNTEKGKEPLIPVKDHCVDIEGGSRSSERSTSSRRQCLPSSRLFSVFDKVSGLQSLTFW